jgi:hypothetical protein
MGALVCVIGWSTFALSEPPAGYPPGKPSWQITFERGKTENPDQAFWLDYCVAILQVEPKTNIDIMSYGDLGESVDVNVDLAQKRGEWVLARIRSAVVEVDGRVRYRGSTIDPRRLKIVNRGGDEAGREYNQVEIYYR